MAPLIAAGVADDCAERLLLYLLLGGGGGRPFASCSCQPLAVVSGRGTSKWQGGEEEVQAAFRRRRWI